MKIVKLEDFHADGGWRTWDYLKITTDEGLVGWAEYAEGFGAGGVTALLHRFAPIVAGLDPRQVGRITSMLQSITRLAAGGLNNQAIAAIENVWKTSESRHAYGSWAASGAATSEAVSRIFRRMLVVPPRANVAVFW